MHRRRLSPSSPTPRVAFELRSAISAVYAGEADLGECLATARRITAAYRRTAEFFLHGDPDDPRIVTWSKGRDAFVAALAETLS